MKGKEDISLFSKIFIDDEKYNKSIQTFRLIQIRAITILTGILYIVYSKIDQYILPEDIMNIASNFHLYIIAPILFIISFLTYFPKYYTKMIFMLMIAPICAAIVNLILVTNIESFTTYMTEIYLIIFWVFTVSGLKLKQSSISVFFISLIAFINYYYIFPLPKELFIMHSFWVFAVLSFGFVGAFLLERLSMKNFITYKKLKDLAITDSLTGLYNRTKLDEILQNELNRSKRYNHNFAFILLDIDHFKEVNDTYGHQIGDKVLIEISNLIKNNSRSTDIIFRWGGEEFIILCLETNKENILNHAENLRRIIQLHKFKSVGSKTVSLGITLSKNDDSIPSIIKRADEALYMAKNQGRNQVVFF
ncbi:MAG: GGDEF domain-containing protein [Arcobacter sp.]|nr:MAG: GGDEF domain-containing protein [Arcobacter sp.]